MNFLARANLKTHARQYVASSIAIIVCCMFIAASSGLASIMQWVTGIGSTGLLQNTQVVVEPNPELAKAKIGKTGNQKIPQPSANATIEELRKNDPIYAVKKVATSLPQVLGNSTKIQASYDDFMAIKYDGRSVMGTIQNYGTAPFYQPALASGKAPVGKEIVVSKDYLDTIKAKQGDTVDLEVSKPDALTPEQAADKGVVESSTELIPVKVSGVVYEDILVATNSVAPIQLSPELTNELSDRGVWQPKRILIHTDLDPHQAVDKTAQYLKDKGVFYDEVNVATVVDRQSKHGSSELVKTLGAQAAAMIFPLLAVLVCIMIVSTTFTVVMARRRREMALMRCIGATAAQVRKSSFQECLWMGALAAGIGSLAGWLLMLGGLLGFGWIGDYATFEQAVGYIPLIISFVVGVLVAVLAGIRPSFGIGKIRPIVALNAHELDEPAKRKRYIARWIFIVIFVLIGAGLWVLASQFVGQKDGNQVFAPILCFFGCIFLFWAALLLSRIALPRFCTLLTKPFASSSATAHMAGLNVSRDPHRTGATATALVLGITLIGSIMVGTFSLQSTINEAVNRHFPIDVEIYSREKPLEPAKITEAMKNKVYLKHTNIPGVALAKVVDSAGKYRQLTALSQTIPDDAVKAQKDKSRAQGDLASEGVLLVIPEDANQIANSKLKIPPEGTVWARSPQSEFTGQKDVLSKEWTFTFANGKELKLKVAPAPKDGVPEVTGYSGFLNPKDYEKLEIPQSKQLIYGALAKSDHNKGAFEVFQAMQDTYSVFGGAIGVNGAALVMAVITVMLNTLMTILVGLLGVSALVALIGVANTLSLSVADRARETALLRAIGYTRGQVKRMLTIEGMLMGLGALIVSFLMSLGFVWYMLRCIPFEGIVEKNELTLNVSWGYWGLIALITLGCCFLAAILPGRRASKASPVEALAAADR